MKEKESFLLGLKVEKNQTWDWVRELKKERCLVLCVSSLVGKQEPFRQIPA